MYRFEWNRKKELLNIIKHGVSFTEARLAFKDPQRVIADDLKHSLIEKRYYCFGKVRDDILTVRFTKRGDGIRMIGAGYWRKGRKTYEEKNQIY